MLKRRFQILAKPITFMTESVNNIMIVCCILHNLIVKDVWGELTPPHSSDEDEEEAAAHVVSTQGGHVLRDTIMRHVTRGA